MMAAPAITDKIIQKILNFFEYIILLSIPNRLENNTSNAYNVKDMNIPEGEVSEVPKQTESIVQEQEVKLQRGRERWMRVGAVVGGLGFTIIFNVLSPETYNLLSSSLDIGPKLLSIGVFTVSGVIVGRIVGEALHGMIKGN